MAITIILLSMLVLGIHKMIESNNPSENQATQSKDKQSLKRINHLKIKKKKDKKMTTKMIIMLLKKNKNRSEETSTNEELNTQEQQSSQQEQTNN